MNPLTPITIKHTNKRPNRSWTYWRIDQQTNTLINVPHRKRTPIWNSANAGKNTRLTENTKRNLVAVCSAYKNTWNTIRQALGQGSPKHIQNPYTIPEVCIWHHTPNQFWIDQIVPRGSHIGFQFEILQWQSGIEQRQFVIIRISWFLNQNFAFTVHFKGNLLKKKYIK